MASRETNTTYPQNTERNAPFRHVRGVLFQLGVELEASIGVLGDASDDFEIVWPTDFAGTFSLL